MKRKVYKDIYQLFKSVSHWGNHLFITSVVRLKKITCVLICHLKNKNNRKKKNLFPRICGRTE